MKKNTFKGLLLIIFVMFSFSVYSQKKSVSITKSEDKTESNIKDYVRCATDEYEESLQSKFSDRQTREEFEEWLAPLVAKINADKAAGRQAQVVYNIPLVVHIIHNGVPVNDKCGIYGENISYAQAFSQVQVLNNDFRALMGTPGGANSTGLAVDTEINFCLAQQDPLGNPTNGIIRHNITPTVNAFTPGDPGDWETFADADNMKTMTQWDPTLYMNMWSIRVGGDTLMNGGMSDLLGYAQFPAAGSSGLGDLPGSATANTDGVVAGHTVFGDISADDGSFTMNPTYALGRTMTHEVGHWIGLYHTFQGGCSGNGDYCADTPAIGAPNYDCVVANSCAGAGSDMIQNYMDYTPDSCMDTFTADQKTRIQAVMSGSPRRNSLNSSNGCNLTGNTYIRFNNGSECFSTVAEGTVDCGFTDYTMTVEATKAPVGGNADVTVTTTGSATDMADYEIIGGNMTFTDATDKTFTLRVYNDGFVEVNETVTLTLAVNANGGDALVTTETSKDFVVTITDNDSAVSLNSTVELFNDNFETALAWTTFDEDGDGKNWFRANDQSWSPHQYSGVFAVSQSYDGNPIDPDNYFCSPGIAIPAGVTNAELSLIIGSADNGTFFYEHYTVYISTDKSSAAQVIATGIAFDSDREVPANGTELRTYAIPAGYAGQTVYATIRHHNSYDVVLLGLDDVKVSYEVNTDVQLAVNTADQVSLSGTGTVYTSDTTSGDVVADITSSSAVNYGCVSANVSRAADFGTNAAVMYQVAGVANYVMARTVTIAPTLVQVAGIATVKFYVYADEIQDWVTQTGNVEGDITVIKNNGSTSESVSATLGNFGIYRTIEATFSTGINGTYYFGKASSLLSVLENSFSLFGVYPNPSNGEVTISLSTNENVNISLLDIRGRRVYNKLHANKSSMFTGKVDFSSVSSGIYLLEVKSGSKRAIKKIVIK